MISCLEFVEMSFFDFPGLGRLGSICDSSFSLATFTVASIYTSGTKESLTIITCILTSPGISVHLHQLQTEHTA